MSLAEYRKTISRKSKRSKYGNRKVEIDGHVFDSKMEARYYQHLKLLKQAKQIKDFKLQPKFTLLEAFEKHGEKHRKIEYIADFEVHHLDETIEIIDVKGHETKDFLIKKKLFHYRYPHKLSIVTYDRVHGWIELSELKKLKRR